MRIVFLSHGQNLGGAERCLVEAVRGLMSKGHDVGVIVPSEGDLAPVLRAHGASVFVIASRWWVHNASKGLAWPLRVRYTASHFQAAFQIARVVRGFKSEVVITNSMTVATGALAAKLCGIPHGWYIHEFGERDHELRFDLGARFCFWYIDRMSAKVIVNSKAVYQYIEY